MPASVHARDDYDLIIKKSVEKAVRKALQVRSACLPINNRKAFRIPGQRVKYGAYRGKKLITKTRALIFVPSVGILDVRGCGRPKDRWFHLPRDRIC
jgi:hypothetical protein